MSRSVTLQGAGAGPDVSRRGERGNRHLHPGHRSGDDGEHFGRHGPARYRVDGAASPATHAALNLTAARVVQQHRRVSGAAAFTTRGPEHRDDRRFDDRRQLHARQRRRRHPQLWRDADHPQQHDFRQYDRQDAAAGSRTAVNWSSSTAPLPATAPAGRRHRQRRACLPQLEHVQRNSGVHFGRVIWSSSLIGVKNSVFDENPVRRQLQVRHGVNVSGVNFSDRRRRNGLHHRHVRAVESRRARRERRADGHAVARDRQRVD